MHARKMQTILKKGKRIVIIVCKFVCNNFKFKCTLIYQNLTFFFHLFLTLYSRYIDYKPNLKNICSSEMYSFRHFVGKGRIVLSRYDKMDARKMQLILEDNKHVLYVNIGGKFVCNNFKFNLSKLSFLFFLLLFTVYSKYIYYNTNFLNVHVLPK